MPTLLDRRQFAAAAAGAVVSEAASAAARPRDAETLVAHLYRSLTPGQRRRVVFAFDHPLRWKVDNNWHVSDARVGAAFDRDQQALIGEIFRGLHSEEFRERALARLHDDGGGLGNYSVALFGEPDSGKFEFVLSGRHCTLRCDGDSVEGAAFGGPIFYGHQGESFHEKPDHPGNVYWYQALSANRVFQALDGKQRAAALLGSAEPERGVKTATPAMRPGGLPVAGMSRDQRGLVEKTLDDLLLPFRDADRAEARKLIAANGGVEALSMAFFRDHDLGGDGVWDVWQIESPAMVWRFRGAPHAHVWVNVQANPGWKPPA